MVKEYHILFNDGTVVGTVKANNKEQAMEKIATEFSLGLGGPKEWKGLPTNTIMDKMSEDYFAEEDSEYYAGGEDELMPSGEDKLILLAKYLKKDYQDILYDLTEYGDLLSDSDLPISKLMKRFEKHVNYLSTLVNNKKGD